MTIAIGDIHGNLEHLEILLNMIPENEQLVFLGDYIDRGPDSYGVINKLKQLEKENPDYIFLRGNHEQMALDACLITSDSSLYMMWVTNGGRETLQSYYDNNYKVLQDCNWFKTLDYFYENDTTIFVHAGINLSIGPDMNKQHIEDMIWMRRWWQSDIDWTQNKKIVFGHTLTRNMKCPSDKDIFVSPNGKYVGIDTGCFFSGHLTAYNPDTGEIWQTDKPIQKKKN